MSLLRPLKCPCQGSDQTVCPQGVHCCLVGLAARHRTVPRLHSGLQDGRPLHLLLGRRGSHLGSVGNPRHQEGPQYGAYVLDIANLTGAHAYTQNYVTRHFVARVLGLIVWPFTVYLIIFWIHFRILVYSGPGDTFMSPAFQETLKGNELLLNSQGQLVNGLLRLYD